MKLTRLSRTARRARDRQAALDMAHHAYAIQRANALTRDEAERQALIRFGPVPAVCRRCQQNPPKTILMVGAGEWLCNACAHPRGTA